MSKRSIAEQFYKIKKEWLNHPEEALLRFRIVSKPNENDLVDIEPTEFNGPIFPLESVRLDMLEKV